MRWNFCGRMICVIGEMVLYLGKENVLFKVGCERGVFGIVKGGDI